MGGAIYLMKRSLLLNKLTLDSIRWESFRLGDLFEIENCKCSKVSGMRIGNVPYIGATNNNNGVIKFIEYRDALMSKGNCIVFICDGEGSIGLSIYKREDFIGTTTVKIGRNININRYTGTFITTIADKVRGKYNFGYKRNEKNLKREKLMLPVDSLGDPNWQFMEDYMKQQEEKLLKLLKDKLKNKNSLNLERIKPLYECDWKEFQFLEIFDEIQRGKRLTKQNQFEGNMPYVSSTSVDNGVDSFIGNKEGVRVFENCLTLANSGSVGSTFFHHYKFIASDHVTKLKREGLDNYVYQFMLPMLNRLSEKYSFNREINDIRIKREKILLPINNYDLPDFEYMSNYMKKIESEKIKAYFQKKKLST